MDVLIVLAVIGVAGYFVWKKHGAKLTAKVEEIKDDLNK